LAPVQRALTRWLAQPLVVLAVLLPAAGPLRGAEAVASLADCSAVLLRAPRRPYLARRAPPLLLRLLKLLLLLLPLLRLL
jgi:hypothetical protein